MKESYTYKVILCQWILWITLWHVVGNAVIMNVHCVYIELHHLLSYNIRSTVLIRMTQRACKWTPVLFLWLQDLVSLYLLSQSCTVTGWESLLSLFNSGFWLCPPREGETVASKQIWWQATVSIGNGEATLDTPLVVVGQRWPGLWHKLAHLSR